MELVDSPVVDVRPVLVRERMDLLAFLGDLRVQDWAAPSAAPGWSVKDLALHLLDDDLGLLSRDRDGDRTGLLDMSDRGAFIAALNAKNQRWIDGARGLSPRVIVDLLEWSGAEMDDYYAALDITRNEGAVSWASDGPVPVWFDIAQDLTERWVHCQQMREAVNRPGDYAEKYLEFVLRTFVWALPHQYRVPAPAGTQVEVDLEVGRWCLTFDSLRWSLQETAAEAPAASVHASADSAWRWLTGGSYDETQLIKDGPASLVEPLLKVRAILV